MPESLTPEPSPAQALQAQALQAQALQAQALAARLAQLSPDKRALLERKLLEQGKKADAGSGRIPRREDPAAPVELSHSQELMWLLDRLSPGGNAYNSPSANRIRGPLDAEVLERALQAQIDRHEILRTRYPEIDGRPMQVVSAHEDLKLMIVDLSSDAPGIAEAEMSRLLKEAAEAPFDLQCDLLVRATLYRLADDDHVLMIVIHHIAVDGWSKGILWTELSSLYDAFSNGQANPLTSLPLQYADFAIWHRASVASSQLRAQLSYWREQLGDVPPLLELPTDRVRPDVLSHRGDHLDELLPLSSLQGLQEVAREEGATLFMAVLAAFGALLGRYSGQTEVVVGTPIAGRSRVELEELVGYFMNTLALRVDLSGDPSFRELVRRARESTLGAFANQEVPFEEVVSAVNPPRDLSRTPLFQVMLVLQNQKKSVFRPLGMDGEPVRFDRDWSKFDITLGMGERAAGLNTNWEYSTDLFDEATIRQMMSHFATLLAAVAQDPDAPLSAVVLLSEDEARHVTRDFNPAPVPIPQPHSLWDRFVAQATRTPDAVAVEGDRRAMSYDELRRTAEVAAGHLRAAGVGRGDVVGICIDHSVELVVADLAVLAAGAACLPLDPGYPQARITAVLEEARPSVVVTARASAGAVANWPTLIVEDLTSPVADSSAGSSAGEIGTAGPLDPAYVIFTSGSTGRPKGVVLPHQGLVNHADSAAELFALRPGDRVLQFASVAFDISVEEIYPTLFTGGTVVARPADLALGGPELVEWLEAKRISVLDLPTAFWHEWVGDLALRGLQLPTHLRHVTVGGEKASAATYDTWTTLAGDRVTWINTYGPTEASVIATAWAPPRDWSRTPGQDLPIGRPVRNASVYLLDQAGQPVPVGVRGELWIGGAGLATGYLGRPDLTADVFRDDPFSDTPGARMYRTGDLARHLPTGIIEFAGRVDEQIKLRGFRIEPGEIEAALAQQPEVTEALVVLHGSGGDGVLVGYVACPGVTDEALGAELRARLAQQLPPHLVPSAVVVLPALPRTPNGKVDKNALPQPEFGARTVVAPRTELERQLAAIWQEILGIDAVGVTDGFFDLGGHSLLAVRMFAVLEQRHGHRLPLAAIVATPTIEGLAAQLTALTTSDAAGTPYKALIPLQSKGSRPPLFLVHDVWGQVIGYRGIVDQIGPDQPVYGFEPVGVDGSAPMHSSIEEMASFYITEMLEVQPDGPYYLGGSCFGGDVAYEMAVQLRRQDRDVALVALLDAVPFGHGKRAAARSRRRRRAEWLRVGSLPRGERKAFVKGRLVDMRSDLYNTLWWAAAGHKLQRGEILTGRLHNVRYVQNHAAATYTAPRFDGTVTLVLPRDPNRGSDDRRLEWRNISAGVDMVEIKSEGGHRQFLHGDHVGDIARALRQAIDNVLPGRG